MLIQLSGWFQIPDIQYHSDENKYLLGKLLIATPIKFFKFDENIISVAFLLKGTDKLYNITDIGLINVWCLEDMASSLRFLVKLIDHHLMTPFHNP